MDTPTLHIAFDIGGTFTDVVASTGPGSGLVRLKCPSILQESIPALTGLISDLREDSVPVDIAHGTTICSNAILEGQLPRTAFIVTEGFRDLLQLMGQRGPATLDLSWERIAPLVPPNLTFVVSERILTHGTVDVALTAAEVERVVSEVVAADVDTVAVCLINSFANPDHEKMIKSALLEAGQRRVSISSEVDPEAREFERASTTVLNAALLPIVEQYLDQVQQGLSQFSPNLRIMQSNGGTMSPELALERPISMLESGPAAGALAAARFARQQAVARAMSFDMGGTTAKVCLLTDGQAAERAGSEVGGALTASLVRGLGHPVRMPALDLVEVGAGGGSIAWIDNTQSLKVGPRSAGALPGPACYPHGGELPTVTDANLVLGYLPAGKLGSSGLTLSYKAAWEAIDKHIARPLKMPVRTAALGIIEVANATMMRALRSVSTARGHDIRQFSLITFGGSGPLHAAQLAARVGVSTVIVPQFAGVFSAVGLLLADQSVDLVRSVEQSIEDVTDSDLSLWVSELRKNAVAESARTYLFGARESDATLEFELGVDMRVGVSETEIAIGVPDVEDISRATLTQLFEEEHKREFGYTATVAPQIVNMRLRATIRRRDVTFRDVSTSADVSAAPGAYPTRRNCYFRDAGLVECPVIDRHTLSTGAPVTGPAIIDDADCSIVVPPGWMARQGPSGAAVLEQVPATHPKVSNFETAGMADRRTP